MGSTYFVFCEAARQSFGPFILHHSEMRKKVKGKKNSKKEKEKGNVSETKNTYAHQDVKGFHCMIIEI